MDDLLPFEDSSILICPRCERLTFDPKVCVYCHAEIPPYIRIKILNKNNKVYEITGHQLGNFSNSTCVFLNETLSSRAVPKVTKLSRSATESDLERIHNENCVCAKYLKTEDEVKKSYSTAEKGEIMEELAEEQIEHASEELGQTADDRGHSTKDHEHITEEENSPALATSSPSKVHPAVRSFPINDKDIACLAIGKMLNDSIIDFYLNYIYYEMIPAEFQVRTHIFNSFFYMFLSNTFKQKNASKNWLEKRVNNSIKNVDIFSKDFIFVPVNRNKHWYLAVICYLTQLNENSHEGISVESKESSEEKHSECNSQSPRKKNYTYPDKGKPCICFFDSFDKSTTVKKGKTSVAENLKEFFKILWISKNPEKPYDWASLPCFKAVCPQQENDVDCGLYLLQYAESFFKNPIPNLGNSMPVLKNWFSQSIMTRKRDHIKKVISELKRKQPKAACPASSCGSDVIVLKDENEFSKGDEEQSNKV